MPSKFYVENYKKTNEWLRENAPDYVNQCVQELTNYVSQLGERTLKAELAMQTMEKGFYKGLAAINEIHQLSDSIKANQEYSSNQLKVLCDELEAAESVTEPKENQGQTEGAGDP